MKNFLWIFAAILAVAMPNVATAQSGSSAPSREGFRLAFVEADVRRVVDAVLGSMMGVDYSIDPAVQGNLTLRTSGAVPREALIPLLEQALAPLGAVIVAQDGGYRVMPRAKARVSAPIAGGADAGPKTGFASEVVSLQRIGAASVAKLLQQLLGEEVVLAVDEMRNQIVIAGTADEREAARRLIARFDVDALADMQFELVRLENVDPETLHAELLKIFEPPYDIVGTRLRLIPLTRLRSILVIAATRADIDRVLPWIKRLDAGVAGKRRIYNYPVQNGRARDLAATLQLVLGAGLGASQEQPGYMSRPSASTANTADLDVPPGSAGAEPGARGPGMGTDAAQAGPRIVPNDSNNSLLIYANGEEYDLIMQAVRQIDQPVPQVLIEVTLAEVLLTNELRFGVNFTGVSGNVTGTQSNAATPIPTSIFPGFSVSVNGSSAQAVLNALQARTNVQVLSAPKLIVLNNQTATLQVGDQVPIVIQQSQSVVSPGAPVVNTVELRDTGVILKVTPRVNDSGVITIDITQEVSDVAPTTTSGINSPTIQQRRMTTTVSTRSGQMVALGGLIRTKQERGRQGIPLLSQIPILGGLFGSHTDSTARTELIILLTPTIIRSPDHVKDVVDTLIDGLDATAPLVRDARDRQVGGNVAP